MLTKENLPGPPKAAAKITGQILTETHKNAIADRRPYIWTHQTDIPPKNDEIHFNEALARVEWTFHFTNYGRSPAVDYQLNAHVTVGPDAMSKVRWENIPDLKTGAILPPGDDGFSTPFSESGVTLDEFLAVSKSNREIVMFGHFAYWGIVKGGVKLDQWGGAEDVLLPEACSPQRVAGGVEAGGWRIRSSAASLVCVCFA